MRKRLIFPAVLIGAVVVVIAVIALAVNGIDYIANSDMGMTEIRLPSGSVAYFHRWTHGKGPDQLYLSGDADYCSSYSRSHDYLLPRLTTGDPEKPVLISVSGNSIVIHAPQKLTSPRFSPPKGFQVTMDPLSVENYRSFTSPNALLPDGWQRIEVAFGHNTCSL